MRIYIAAPFAARPLVATYADALRRWGHECTSTWASSTREIQVSTLGASWGTSDEGVREHALGDLKDVMRSDALIMLTAGHVLAAGVPDQRLHTGGRHTELGMAVAAGKPCVVIGWPENIFHRGLCGHAGDLEDAVGQLKDAQQKVQQIIRAATLAGISNAATQLLNIDTSGLPLE